MNERPLCEQVNVWRIPRFNNMELLRARYTHQNFSRHTHDQFALGVIESGGMEFDYLGQRQVAPAGSVNLCIAGETHDGHPAVGEGWAYRMFYFDPAVLQQMACEMSGRPTPLPYFSSGVIHDDILAARIRRLHTLLEEGQLTALDRDHYLDQVLSRLIQGHAQNPPEIHPAGFESPAVERLREYLEANYDQDISSDDLSRVALLSRFHLNRVFSQATGIPPHAYLRQVRIQRAKRLLAQGQPIAGVALRTGFSDQAHLNRWFKRLCGFTPGEYSNSVQYD